MELKTNRDVFYHQRRLGKRSLLDFQALEDALMIQLNITTEEMKKKLTASLRKFCCRLHARWVQSSYNEDKFLKYQKSWLDREFSVLKSANIETRDQQYEEFVQEDFNFNEDAGEHTHTDRRIQLLQEEYTAEELMHAAKIKARAEKKKDMEEILDYLLKHPEDAGNISKFCEKRGTRRQYSPEKALGIITSLNLTKFQYISLRKAAMEEGVHIYPTYYRIQEIKLQCYPEKEAMKIDEKSATIELQALLDHTVSRILLTVNIDNLNDYKNLILVSKWGCDGASGQKTYKQRFASDTYLDESSVFISTVVPIKLYDTETEDVIWINDRASSTRYCRPICFTFSKETTELIKNFVQDMEHRISDLNPSVCGEHRIAHKLHMTMIDGKICNALADTSSMKCYICKAKPTEMNRLDLISTKQPIEDYYKFGLSTLHAWIRSFECLIHIAYNLDFQKWSASTPEYKSMQLERKKRIQTDFRKEVGINIDIVKQGAGTSNDGNTARRFFEDPKKTSRITGIDEGLIYRFAVILQVIACSEKVDPKKFGQYATETAELYVEKYGWYYMPATVHKILIHGKDIIENSILPIGQLSEEAQEARNKEFKKYREHHSRKFCRRATNEDILHNLLISSDPYLSSIRPCLRTKRKQELFQDALNLLETDLTTENAVDNSN